jgi:hypothetical protein
MRVAKLQSTLAVAMLTLAAPAMSEEPRDPKQSPGSAEASSGSAFLEYLGVALLGAVGGAGATLLFLLRRQVQLRETLRADRDLKVTLSEAARLTDGRLTSLQNDIGRILRCVIDVNSGVNALGTAIQALERETAGPEVPTAQPPPSSSTSAAFSIVASGLLSPSFTSHGGLHAGTHQLDEPPPLLPTAASGTEGDEATRKLLGEIFVKEIKALPGQDFSRLWEAFLAKLRTRYPEVEAGELYWDRTATGKFVERQLNTFRDTGKCQVLLVGAERYLFFPELAAFARKVDLPYCEIEASNAVLDAQNLLEFIPPRVTRGPDGCSVVREGAIKYR